MIRRPCSLAADLPRVSLIEAQLRLCSIAFAFFPRDRRYDFVMNRSAAHESWLCLEQQCARNRNEFKALENHGHENSFN
ncbi:hypothetical protein DVJ77_19360 [Dyella tabacisoli]|uniref:Uncharacterized protein n=1 Tax=Dyella tabacisoli TaxID=2282381 RepID=A0A369UH03_9GAMM|nr:hypothetical protein DVJ77_19360 [Dyella tabacisoli]